MDRTLTGTVSEALPSLKFKIQFKNGYSMIAYLSGRMHKNFIRIVVGDTVDVFVPSTGDIGRIIKRR
jgi:translation initiation factor IF-1